MSRISIIMVILCFLLIIINGCLPALSSGDLPIESDHPYSNNEKKTWIINRSGVDEMKLHFEYIRLAPSDDPNYYNWDRIIISDKYDNVLAIYEGIVGGPSMVPLATSNAKDIWTSWYPEDTIKVTLVTNEEGFDDGFKIDDVQTRLDETIENSENVDPNSSKTLESPNPQSDSTVKDKVLTATTLTSSTNLTTSGQPVTLTAEVDTPSQETEEPSGTVTFMDGNTAIGTADLTSGQAILATSSLSVGLHSITAEYSGDSNFKSSTSSPFILTVKEQTNIGMVKSSSEDQSSSEQLTSSDEKSSTEQNSAVKGILTLISENPLISTIIGGIIVAIITKKPPKNEKGQS
ncbi:hypothetical protein MSKOL_2646 [Methanosarcina sp. Kolksee]|uniref:Ig-like domain-containing protein n=1 Tax=Methanosarcina sp. Kolksee TaxID=1434099 RepID=UPI0006157D3C|nr:Ig-like domain-containing protein [Methanosarcina sp. Kolksee]AKB48423.1 hypothetical protein MSKOL_2646 [Methanosarcina sp. Kolksee]